MSFSRRRLLLGAQKLKQCWVSHCVKTGERPWRPMQLESAITLNIRGGATVLLCWHILIGTLVLIWCQSCKMRKMQVFDIESLLRFETRRFAHLKASPFAYRSWPQLWIPTSSLWRNSGVNVWRVKVIDLEQSTCQTLHTFVPSMKPLFLHSGMTQRHGTKCQILEPS